jgi:hypothetical protein
MKSSDMKKAANISSTIEAFQKILRFTVSCWWRSMYVYAPTKGFKLTPAKASKGLFPMKIGYGLIFNALKISPAIFNIGILIWQITSLMEMECSSSTADGSSTS